MRQKSPFGSIRAASHAGDGGTKPGQERLGSSWSPEVLRTRLRARSSAPDEDLKDERIIKDLICHSFTSVMKQLEATVGPYTSRKGTERSGQFTNGTLSEGPNLKTKICVLMNI